MTGKHPNNVCSKMHSSFIESEWKSEAKIFKNFAWRPRPNRIDSFHCSPPARPPAYSRKPHCAQHMLFTRWPLVQAVVSNSKEKENWRAASRPCVIKHRGRALGRWRKIDSCGRLPKFLNSFWLRFFMVWISDFISKPEETKFLFSSNQSVLIFACSLPLYLIAFGCIYALKLTLKFRSEENVLPAVAVNAQENGNDV